MELYLGGRAQGKLSYVTQKYGLSQEQIHDGGAEELSGVQGEGLLAFDRFHLWFRRLLAEGEDAERRSEELLRAHPSCIVLCDEVGNGIVPLSAFEREYRERLGRTLCRMAAQAEHVERVICGIGQTLK